MNNTTIEEKDLVWLPKSLAEKVKQLEEGREQEKLVLTYLEESKSSLKADLETLDEDVAIYVGLMTKARQSFEKAKNEQLNSAYTTWEKFDEELGELRKKVKTVSEEVKPIKDELEQVNELLRQVHSWEINDLLKTVEALRGHLSGDRETAKILRFLYKTYGKTK